MWECLPLEAQFCVFAGSFRGQNLKKTNWNIEHGKRHTANATSLGYLSILSISVQGFAETFAVFFFTSNIDHSQHCRFDLCTSRQMAGSFGDHKRTEACLQWTSLFLFKLGASRLDKIWTQTAFWNPRKNAALVADRSTYNAVLSSFSYSGQWRHAATLTNDMIASFYLPDDISCDAAFGACKQASQASAALSFLERIQQVGASVLFLQEQNNCKSLLESVDFIRLPDGYGIAFSHLFTSFHIIYRLGIAVAFACCNGLFSGCAILHLYWWVGAMTGPVLWLSLTQSGQVGCARIFQGNEILGNVVLLCATNMLYPFVICDVCVCVCALLTFYWRNVCIDTA